jgi:hypothetical protein
MVRPKPEVAGKTAKSKEHPAVTRIKKLEKREDRRHAKLRKANYFDSVLHPLAVLKKKPAAADKKKPATGQMAGCYVTIAEAHHDGNYRTNGNPAMFMEVGATAAWLAGELSYDYCNTCIGGPGRIKRMPGGGLIISNSRNARLLVDVIQTETTMGQGQPKNYSGFVSAKVTSIVPGMEFQARMTDPEADPFPEDDSDSKMELAAPSSTVVTQKGDVICTFTVGSINLRAKKPEEFVHLMRPMLASNVEMLKNKGLMWNSLQTADSLSDAIFDMVTALDAMPCP